MELAYKFLRKSASNDIGLCEEMITGKSWWDTLILEEYISRLSGSGEFFIQKAIGWILREYSRANPICC